MTILLDTREVPPGDRHDYWSAGAAKHFFPVRFRPTGKQPFTGRVTGGEIGPIAVRTISGDRHSAVRTPHTIEAADPKCIMLYLMRGGAGRFEQDGRSCVLAPGDMASHDSSLPSLVETPAGFELLVFSIPKWLIGAQVDRIASRTSVRMAADSRFLVRLAGPMLRGLADVSQERDLSGHEGEGSAETLLALLGALHADDAGRQSHAERSNALLVEMRKYAMEHLNEPDLGPELLARQHFVSPRYVHKLFAAEGSGVAEWIRERRLEGALRDLRAPLSEDRTIAGIAASWGFPDPASFSRAFRKAYGRTPRELRAIR